MNEYEIATTKSIVDLVMDVNAKGIKLNRIFDFSLRTSLKDDVTTVTVTEYTRNSDGGYTLLCEKDGREQGDLTRILKWLEIEYTHFCDIAALEEEANQ